MLAVMVKTDVFRLNGPVETYRATPFHTSCPFPISAADIINLSAREGFVSWVMILSIVSLRAHGGHGLAFLAGRDARIVSGGTVSSFGNNDGSVRFTDRNIN